MLVFTTHNIVIHRFWIHVWLKCSDGKVRWSDMTPQGARNVFDAETTLSSVTDDIPQLIISYSSLLSGAVVTW